MGGHGARTQGMAPSAEVPAPQALRAQRKKAERQADDVRRRADDAKQQADDAKCRNEEFNRQIDEADRRTDKAERQADAAITRAARLVGLGRKVRRGQASAEEVAELERLEDEPASG